MGDRFSGKILPQPITELSLLEYNTIDRPKTTEHTEAAMMQLLCMHIKGELPV